MKNPGEKLSQLSSPKKIKNIIKECGNLSCSSDIKIKVLKRYLDDKSYSLVAVYDFGKLKAIGVANSGGIKEYSWKTTQSIYPSFRKSKIFSIPEAYCYNKQYGIFFREYRKGRVLGKSLKTFGGKREITLIRELLYFLTTIRPRKGKEIKNGIFFSDFEKNIEILEERKKAEILKRPYSVLKGRIEKIYADKKRKVFVHGDFNPYNIIMNPPGAILIDMEKAHFGAREEDSACFLAHLKYSPDFNLKNKDIEYWEETISRGHNKKKFETFESYFGLLIASHIMIWGNYQTGLEIFEKIFRNNLKK